MAQVPKFTKIQELIYELPIERVMKKNVITVSPDTLMTELREVLRMNRISGVPVLEKRSGIVMLHNTISSTRQLVRTDPEKNGTCLPYPVLRDYSFLTGAARINICKALVLTGTPERLRKSPGARIRAVETRQGTRSGAALRD